MADETLEQIRSFCQCYFAHPEWADVVSPWVRFSLLPSGYLKEKLRKANIENRVSVREIQIGKGGLKDDKVLSKLIAINEKGYDWYLFINQVRVEDAGSGSSSSTGGYYTNSDIEKRLFLALDFDFRLPCSLGELEQEIGLQFAWVVESSRGRDFGKIQAVVPVLDTGSIEDREPWNDAARELCGLLGSDPVHDAKRLLRVRGSFNFKYVRGTRTPTAPQQVRTLVLRSDYEVYGLSDVQEKLGKLRGSAFSTEMVSRSMDPRERGTKGNSSPRGSGSTCGVPLAEDGQIDYGNWREVLQRIVSVGAPVFGPGCGFRHNALRTWAAQMCWEGLEDMAIQGAIGELARGAFAEPYDGDEEREDIKKLLRTTRGYRVQVEKESRLFSEAGGPYEEQPARKATQRIKQQEQNTHENAKKHRSSEEMIPEDGERDNSSLTLVAFAKSLARQLPTESREEWLKWLLKVAVLGERAGNKDREGYEPLCTCLHARLDGLRTISGPSFRAPIWNDVVLASEFLTGKNLESFLRQYVSACSSSLFSYRAEVRELGNQNGVNARTKLFWSAKGEMLRQVVRGILDNIELNRRVLACPPAAVIVQNGVFPLKTGNFVGDDDAVWCEQARWKYLNPINAWFVKDQLLNGYGIADLGSDGILEHMPMFKAYLEDAFPGEGNKSTRLELVPRIIGYCLVRGNIFQKFFAFIGASGSGKSVFCELLTHLVGEWNAVTVAYPSLEEPWGWGPVEDKLLCVADEAEDADRSTHENCMSTLKRYTGSEKFALRRMREDSRSVETTAKIVIVCNKDLIVSDTHGALARRMVCLYFANIKPLEQQIDSLGRRIVEAEGSLVATWAILSLGKAWSLKHALFEVQDSLALSRGREEMAISTNPILDFCRKCIVGNRDLSLPSNILVEIVKLLVADDRMQKQPGHADRNVKQAMAQMGYEYSHVAEFRGYRGCTLALEQLSLFADIPLDSLPKWFAHSTLQDRLLPYFGLRELLF